VAYRIVSPEEAAEIRQQASKAVNNPRAPKGTAPALDRARGILLLKRGPVSLEANEQDTLKALVETGASTLQRLRSDSGCEHPDRILRKLVTKYPELAKRITLPGKKGLGGYSTTIQFA
jgi:hypothetical protein